MIELKKVSKFYHNNGLISVGFSKIDINFDIGEFVVITGQSGSGKSTLMNVIAGLDSYEEGEMFINGEETSGYSEEDYERYRKSYVGNIFQTFNLINSYTVYQNIELELLINGFSKKEAKEKVLNVIKQVDLEKYKNTKVSKLSGGQKQRVAIARSLVFGAKIILADEPTGNLDKDSAEEVMKLLHEISKDKLVIIVTHNYDQVKNYATRHIKMGDGKILEDYKIKDVIKIENTDLNTTNNITNTSKTLLGIRNTFNIFTKFVLLSFVYLVMIIALTLSYTSNVQTSDLQEQTLTNNYFQNKDLNRVVLKKKDGSSFTKEEIENLKNNEVISHVDKFDILEDMYIDVYSDDYYYSVKVKYLSEFNSSLESGKMPEKDNEIIFSRYYDNGIKIDEINILGNDLKVSGIVKSSSDGEYYYNDIIYVNENVMEKIFNSVMLKKYLSFENNDVLISKVVVNKDLKPGEILIGSSFGLSENTKLVYENLYTKKVLEEKIIGNISLKKVDSIKNLNYDIDESNISSSVEVSEEDYNKLIDSGIYQLSVFGNNEKDLGDIEKLDYDHLIIKDSLTKEAEIQAILKLFVFFGTVFNLILLFFISYFVIQLILRSRNVYYSTLRILGARLKDVKDLLKIELITVATTSYIIFLGFLSLVKSNIIKINFVKDILDVLVFKDYVIVYLILIVLSIMISNRYSKKKFKKSAMLTYREGK